MCLISESGGRDSEDKEGIIVTIYAFIAIVFKIRIEGWQRNRNLLFPCTRSPSRSRPWNLMPSPRLLVFR